MSASTPTPEWQPWKSAISDSDETTCGSAATTRRRSCGRRASPTSCSCCTGAGCRTAHERRLIDAILIAVSDHGPGSPSAAAARVVATGSRLAPEAAVAAGVLAIGDSHAGAGLACMQLIAEGLQLKRDENLSMADAAARILTATKERGARFPRPGAIAPTRPIRARRSSSTWLARAAPTAMASRSSEPWRRRRDARSSRFRSTWTARSRPCSTILGFPPLFAKFIFIIGRVAGLTAQVTEEYTREKPMRIRIPVVYDGDPPKG